MRAPLYRYNTETCRYELTRRSWINTVFYGISVLFVAALLLGGMLFLHDFFLDSPRELELRAENKALRKNQNALNAELAPVEAKLVSLKEKDVLLHAKFFGAGREIAAQQVADHSNILLFGIDDYPDALKELEEKSSALKKRSHATSMAFAEKLKLHEGSFLMINVLPLIPPVDNFQPETILSGFGTRVNPFHKGLYEHQGIDIALPRGTEVVTTANGEVITVRNSDIQAGFGNYIEVDHGQGIVTRYAHLDEIKVRIGQKVTKGFIIGLSGNSGGSIAPHLHYEIIRNEKSVDPIDYMLARLNPERYEVAKAISATQNQSLD